MSDMLPSVSAADYYLDPDEHPPPLNKKMCLATHMGTGCIGKWEPGGGYVGWHPMFKLTPKMKDKIAVASGLGNRHVE